MRLFAFFVVHALLVSIFGQTEAQEIESNKLPDTAGVSAAKPLPSAHAHNDYRHKRPLLDALEHGFCSVEADIYLVDGKLLVAHDRSELPTAKTLQELYLDPLQRRVKQFGGRVYPDGPTLMLLIDIKADGQRAYAALREQLLPYREMLSGLADDHFQERAVRIVISGDRPIAEITADPERLVGIDGRLPDLKSNVPAHLMPLISESWLSHFTWLGLGEFSEADRKKLHSIVERAHAADRKVRFWATPESPLLWRELRAAGVDYLNTDQLAKLQAFLQAE